MALPQSLRYRTAGISSLGISVSANDQDYQDALRELNEIEAAAIEEKYEIPTRETVESARELLEKMYAVAPFPYDVSPEEDGGVSIHAIGDETYIWAILSPDGRDRCFVSTEHQSWRLISKNREKLFGSFLRAALRDLRKEGERSLLHQGPWVVMAFVGIPSGEGI